MIINQYITTVGILICACFSVNIINSFHSFIRILKYFRGLIDTMRLNANYEMYTFIFVFKCIIISIVRNTVLWYLQGL